MARGEDFAFKQHLRTYLTIPADVDRASTWRRLTAECRLAGLSVADNDLWMASTAKRWDIPLATRDGKLRRVLAVRFIPDSLPPADA
jgi:predicted nucleic acid-binding protein